MKIQKILLKHISIINEHSSPTILYFVSYGWGTLLDFIDSISKTKIPFEHKQPLLGDDEESPLVAYCNKIRQDKNICNIVYDINDETIYFTKNSYDTKSNEDLEI